MGLAPGLVSAGLGEVPLAQTYLDTSQGNRLDEDLYDGPLPPVDVEDGRVPPATWDRITARAAGAPAEIVPGLLASTLERAGVPVTVDRDAGLATLIGVDRSGAARVAAGRVCTPGCPPDRSTGSPTCPLPSVAAMWRPVRRRTCSARWPAARWRS